MIKVQKAIAVNPKKKEILNNIEKKWEELKKLMIRKFVKKRY